MRARTIRPLLAGPWWHDYLDPSLWERVARAAVDWGRGAGVCEALRARDPGQVLGG